MNNFIEQNVSLEKVECLMPLIMHLRYLFDWLIEIVDRIRQLVEASHSTLASVEEQNKDSRRS